ncbi:MAG TPA: hypothetical protein VHY56_10225 [Candidatus Binataceae bacterium]|nr:hypothetical protein [Candidatus Binataceae bacterium]
MSGEVEPLAGDRVVSHERTRPADFRHDETFDSDTRDLILRILVVGCLGALFWQAIIAVGML